ncbi:MAG TPA: hypothetical protein VFJ16_29610 [Longimicrobium sp.]|nr:hypothetical protein [Longimicrobium sp.]
MRRTQAVLAALALFGAAACNEARADVEPLPPLHRPTPEERAGLPVLSGRWLFTGFEYPVRDTLRVREQVYRLVPPGEFRIVTQRLDSIAGQYVRDSVAFPMTGEVRRDGIFSFVAFEPGGVGQFVAGRVVKDTLWIELTGFPSAGSWPPGTRAALVRTPRGAPFVRLRGYVPPPPPPVDSTKAGEEENGERPSVAPPPPPPPPAPVEEQPRPRPAPPPPPAPEEIPEVTAPPPAPFDTLLVPQPPAQQPRPQRGRRRPPTEVVPPPPPPAPPPADDPRYQMPRDTIRIGNPPR